MKLYNSVIKIRLKGCTSGVLSFKENGSRYAGCNVRLLLVGSTEQYADRVGDQATDSGHDYGLE